MTRAWPRGRMCVSILIARVESGQTICLFPNEPQAVSPMPLKHPAKTSSPPALPSPTSLRTPAIRQAFMRDEEVEIHCPNSAGKRRLLRSDFHLRVSMTQWMDLRTRNGAPPREYFQINFTPDRGMY